VKILTPLLPVMTSTEWPSYRSGAGFLKTYEECRREGWEPKGEGRYP